MEVLQEAVYDILKDGVKIINGCNTKDRRIMNEVLYAIHYKHPEIKFNRTDSDLIKEWKVRTMLHQKDIYLKFNEIWYNKLLFKIFGI